MDEALKETDSDKRLEMYKEIQTYILDACPIVPCFYETISVGTNAKLQGVEVNGESIINMQNLHY